MRGALDSPTPQPQIIPTPFPGSDQAGALSPAPLPAPAIVPAATTYTVKAGDSLWKISKNEGISVAELAAANNISEKSLLQINQVLTIPAKAPAAIVPTAIAPTAPMVSAPPAFDAGSIPAPAGSVYTVKRGDSLWKIARANGTTVNELQRLNNLAGDRLDIGQQLQLPAVTSSALASHPAPTPAPAVRATIAPTGYSSGWTDPDGPSRVIKNNGQQYHVIGYNETLGEIAQKYGVTVPQLKEANGLGNIQIHPGNTLLIPSRADQGAVAPAPGAGLAAIE